MKRKIITTKDGSKTIHLPEIQESYHSKHGALQEAKYVFIDKGWEKIDTDKLNILEIGLGTGLNAILSLIQAENTHKEVVYTGLEAFPPTMEEIELLHYTNHEEIKKYSASYFQIHRAKWGKTIPISPFFKLLKWKEKLHDYQPPKSHFDLIYFDAFGPRVQPEMWIPSIFKKLFSALKQNGVLVTYCAKGQVRRDLETIGFTVERLEGPPGKREMLRAIKLTSTIQ